MIYLNSAPKNVTPNFCSAKEIAEAFALPVEFITENSRAGFIPHYKWHGLDDFLFKKQEVKEWLLRNVLLTCTGREFPRKLTIASKGKEISFEDIRDIPPELLRLKNLRHVPKIYEDPGVYFLCREGEIIYVGASVAVAKRVMEHTDKNYDHAYYIPVPVPSMAEVEGAFIRHFKPKENRWVQNDGRSGAPNCDDPEKVVRALQEIK
jgi:hypothetical protein